ncbi:MAG: hypothetical protein AB9Q20_11360 [Candidatus Reddybacter sp.]
MLNEMPSNYSNSQRFYSLFLVLAPLLTASFLAVSGRQDIKNIACNYLASCSINSLRGHEAKFFHRMVALASGVFTQAETFSINCSLSG